MNKFILPKLVMVAALSVAPGAHAATQAAIDTTRAHALAWLIAHQKGDGRWRSAPRLDIQTTATTLLGLEAAGVTTSYARDAGLNWLGNAHVGSVDALARQAAVLGRFGRTSDVFFTSLANARSEPQKAWGAYPGYRASLPDTPLALEAYRLAGVNYADAGSSIVILANTPASGGARNTDGGWPYEAPESGVITGLKPALSRVIPTAFTITALSRWLPAPSVSGFNTHTSISAGINWLLTQNKG